MPEARSGPADKLRSQRELPSVSATPCQTRSQLTPRVAPRTYTFARDTHSLPRRPPRRHLHNGLDLSPSMFAPCLLGCPGTPLLIRGFGVRVPGGAPVLTWSYVTPGLSF